ncbi:hypothetical protein H5410_059895 [Solanum commersonii]|uniref:Uncharacterized protein n=1 Tax=Solanum commersonii TaxID=4109 RepID=A0A9J5W411_SOLCO|nr:hypothetical protein H5410_059895 [Solanum commersonii]
MQASALTKQFQPCQSRPIDLVATRWRHVDRKSVVFGEESLLPCSSRPCFAVRKKMPRCRHLLGNLHLAYMINCNSDNPILRTYC